MLFMCFIFGIIGYFLIYLAFKASWFSLVLFIAQMPILMVVYWTSIKYLKNKKVSANINKLISITVLTIATFAYIAFIMISIIKFGFSIDYGSTYRTVDWTVGAAYSHEYKLYSDEIPLTCEDLYGPIDYNYYSYKSEIDSSLFLSKSTYRQDSLPAKDSPPEIKYEIIEPQFKFVYRIAKEHLLEIPEWRDNNSFEPIDNKLFNTVEAYQRYYDKTPTGEYILFFENKIIVLDMEKPPTTKQIAIIMEKLGI